MKRIFFLTLIMIIPNVIIFFFAQANAAVFADQGINASWGESLESIRIKFPAGELKKYGLVSIYACKDGRAIFKVPRKDDEKITFMFTENKLTSVDFEYSTSSDNMASLSAILSQKYGEYTYDNYGRIKWPKKDGEVVSLIVTPRGLLGMVAHVLIAYYE